ncbi:sialin-like, partial [Stegodyphus dumicola]|uniref:sialin-like n=1 Tax=Stegodyphus dumicola TaxID=202533 RepID=UPI0015B2E5E9
MFIFLLTAGLGTAAGLVGVCLAGCDVTMNVVFFTCSLAIGGFCYSGYMVSHLDLSPEYAGTLMGIANTISNLTGFLAPSVVGALTENS